MKPELHTSKFRKTEVVVLDPKHLRETLSDQIVTLDGIRLAPTSTVRNLRVKFENDMSFELHMKQFCRTALCTSFFTACPSYL